MVIGLTGKKLSGKGTIAKHLVEERQAKVFRFSQALTDILVRLHKDNSRSNLVALGSSLREAFGNTVLAESLLHEITQSSADIKVVDGVRYVEEYTMLTQLPDFVLVYIEAPTEMRFQRTRNRAEKSDEQRMTLQEFTNRENDATEVHIDRLREKSDYVVANITSIQEFTQSFVTTLDL